ncbi:MAG TPA: DUF2846 domain-containing protein [Chitinophagaceae bacterium]|nr:DUF2846 domain-containing protein [Chitinophagaceae bacterium]
MNRKPVFVLTFLVVFFCLVGFNKPGYVPNTGGPRADSATIYIYRVGQFAGSSANWAMFVDDQKICKLSNNKYIRVVVKPGKHTVSSKQGGIAIMKKETEVEIEAESGGEYFVACNWKTSFTRARLEMIEVTKGTGKKQMEKMSLDNCQEDIDK